MGIGGSILVMVVGAILTFGVNNQNFGPFNLDTIGWILQIAGLAGLILTLWIWNSRRTRVVNPPPQPPPAAERIVPPPPGPDEQIYTERHYN